MALQHGLPLLRPETLKNGAITAELAAFQVDLIVVFAYGRLLPADVFELPPAGTINLHASLLPLLRGASPIQSALLEGFTETGWSVQFIGQGMDTGDVLAETRLAIDPEETAGELGERLVPVGIQLVLETIDRLAATYAQGGDVRALGTPQDESVATHCRKITTEMSQINWHRPAREIHNLVRAFHPRPVARTAILSEGSLLKIHRTRVLADADQKPALRYLDSAEPVPTPELAPGSMVAARMDSENENSGPKLIVTTADGLLEVLELQPENRKKLTAKDFLNGYRTVGPVLLGSITK